MFCGEIKRRFGTVFCVFVNFTIRKNRSGSNHSFTAYQELLQSKRAKHFCWPFVLTNPLNSIAKLQIERTIKNYFLRC